MSYLNDFTLPAVYAVTAEATQGTDREEEDLEKEASR